MQSTLLRGQFGVEESRAQGLNSRGTGFAGFAGVVLSLLTLAVSADVRPGPGAELPGSARWLLAVALWLLVAAVVAVVAGVLRPRKPSDFSGQELEELAEAQDAYDVAVKRLTEAVRAHRAINDEKARWLTKAGAGVSAALALSAVAATIVALD